MEGFILISSVLCVIGLTFIGLTLCDIQKLLFDMKMQLDIIEDHARNNIVDMSEMVKDYDVLTQEIIHLMFGAPKKEGASK